MGEVNSLVIGEPVRVADAEAVDEIDLTEAHMALGATEQLLQDRNEQADQPETFPDEPKPVAQKVGGVAIRGGYAGQHGYGLPRQMGSVHLRYIR